MAGSGKSGKLTKSEKAAKRDKSTQERIARDEAAQRSSSEKSDNAGSLSRSQDAKDAPHPESDSKPGVGDVKAPTWKYTARKTLREFTNDECTDLAAALTYFAVLALFPAIIAILSLVSLVGDPETTVNNLMTIVEDAGGGSIVESIRPTIENLATSTGGGIALILGLATALWSASGYVMAFSRGMNRVYEIGEGRPVWKLRPMMLLITLIMVIMVTLIALMLVASGGLAKSIGDVIGLGSTAVLVYSIVKWPIILILAALTLALLYYSTPNVKQPKFRWISMGAFFAILIWVIASVAFGFYVANFSSYASTYGSLAGVIIFLLWLWITNIALLFGAELDAELERSRQLQGGIEAEENVQLPARDTSKIEKAEEKEAVDIKKGKALRKSAGDTDKLDKAKDSARSK